MPFWHTMDPGEVVDPPRKNWDEWGPDTQERNLRKRLGDGLFDWLAVEVKRREMEEAGE